MLSVRHPTNHAYSSPVGGPGGEWLSSHHSHVAKKGRDKDRGEGSSSLFQPAVSWGKV